MSVKYNGGIFLNRDGSKPVIKAYQFTFKSAEVCNWAKAASL